MSLTYHSLKTVLKSALSQKKDVSDTSFYKK